MTRTLRLTLLVVGLGLVVLLVWTTGPGIVARMLVRVGWSFLAIVAIYDIHVLIRAAALWRVIVDDSVSFADVVRIRFSAEAVEMLTLTGPFLAEPAKGWLLAGRGVGTAAAVAAVITDNLVYTVISSCLAIGALLLLLSSHVLPVELRGGAGIVLTIAGVFVAAFSFASLTGIGLIAPILRASRVVIGGPRAERLADDFARVEQLIIRFLHANPRRLVEVLAIDMAAHLLLVMEVAVVMAALGFPISWLNAAIVEGGVKFVAIAFAFVPGQFGASEGVYAWVAGAIGLPAAAGLSLAFVRRLRAAVAASIGAAVTQRAGSFGR